MKRRTYIGTAFCRQLQPRNGRGKGKPKSRTRFSLAVVLSAAMVFVVKISPARAEVARFGCGDAKSDFGGECSLSELLTIPNGGGPSATIRIDGMVFQNFRNLTISAGVDDRKILVTPVRDGIYVGLTFVSGQTLGAGYSPGSSTLNAFLGRTAVLEFDYDVEDVNGQPTMIGNKLVLDFFRLLPPGGGAVSVTESTNFTLKKVSASGAGVTDSVEKIFPPVGSLTVHTEVEIIGPAELYQFRQEFVQAGVNEVDINGRVDVPCLMGCFTYHNSPSFIPSGFAPPCIGHYGPGLSCGTDYPIIFALKNTSTDKAIIVSPFLEVAQLGGPSCTPPACSVVGFGGVGAKIPVDAGPLGLAPGAMSAPQRIFIRLTDHKPPGGERFFFSVNVIGVVVMDP